mgnify:CR=1 FL=1
MVLLYGDAKTVSIFMNRFLYKFQVTANHADTISAQGRRVYSCIMRIDLLGMKLPSPQTHCTVIRGGVPVLLLFVLLLLQQNGGSYD